LVGREMMRKERERKEYIYVKKTCIPFFVLFCSTNWLATERPQHYTMQCECKDLIMIIEDGIKNGKKKSYKRVGGEEVGKNENRKATTINTSSKYRMMILLNSQEV
jgi:hypothetical protein